MMNDETNPPQNNSIEDDAAYYKRNYHLDIRSIATELHRTDKFIIYLNPRDELSWFINHIPDHAKKSHAEFCRLNSLISINLTKHNAINAYRLIASALNSSLRAQEEQNIAQLYKDAYEYYERNKGEIKRIVIRSAQYCIYITRKNTVTWWHCRTPSENVKLAQAELENTNSMAEQCLNENYSEAIASKLGAALSMAFSKDNPQEIKACFDEVRTFVAAKVQSHLKLWLFITNASVSAIFIAIAFFLSWWLPDLTKYFLCAGAGVVGSMVSSLQRNKTVETDGYISNYGLYCESISRLIIGASFGVLVLLGVMSDLFLPLIKGNMQAIICMSFIAGFSERFVPDLIDNVAKKQKE